MTNESSSRAEIDAHLAEKSSRRRYGIIGAIAAVVLVGGAVTAAVLVQNGAARAGASEKLIPLTIGDTAQSGYQDAVVEVGRENGLAIDFVNFDDPYLPNTALVNGEVDANSFQHVAWLSQFNKQNGTDITPLFSTVVTTWGLFSEDYASVDEIPQGARIAVPDDPSNFSRALFILEAAGLLEVADDAGVFPTEEDITANPRGLQFARIAYESVQTAYSDPTISGVVIAVEDFDPALGLTPDDALQLEDGAATTSSPYVIVVATTPDRVDDPAWALLEKTYRDDRVLAALQKEKRGLATSVVADVADLRAALAELTAQ